MLAAITPVLHVTDGEIQHGSTVLNSFPTDKALLLLMPDVNHNYLNERKALEIISNHLDNPTINITNIADNGTDIQLFLMHWDRAYYGENTLHCN